MTKALLKWVDPTTRVDGSALASSDISSITIHDDTDGLVGSVLPGVQTFTTSTLSVGDHSFYAIAHDTSGHSSGRSNVASVTVTPTLANPAAPSGLTAELVEEPLPPPAAPPSDAPPPADTPAGG
jgi:hypothetical protein